MRTLNQLNTYVYCTFTTIVLRVLMYEVLQGVCHEVVMSTVQVGSKNQLQDRTYSLGYELLKNPPAQPSSCTRLAVWLT